jgi:hypothetical protein
MRGEWANMMRVVCEMQEKVPRSTLVNDKLQPLFLRNNHRSAAQAGQHGRQEGVSMSLKCILTNMIHEKARPENSGGCRRRWGIQLAVTGAVEVQTANRPRLAGPKGRLRLRGRWQAHFGVSGACSVCFL